MFKAKFNLVHTDPDTDPDNTGAFPQQMVKFIQSNNMCTDNIIGSLVNFMNVEHNRIFTVCFTITKILSLH